MKATDLAAKAKDIARNYKTAYIWGGLGQPITAKTIEQAIKQYPKNETYAPRARNLIGKKNAFYFDCVGMIKSILWGWTGDSSKSRGGAGYACHGVPDISADQMISKCTGVSTDFSTIEVGELLWCKGHVGIYIGGGLGVECTPKWDGGVQITAVGNIGKKGGYNTRAWTKHGKLPYVTYTAEKATSKAVEPAKSYEDAYARTYTVSAFLLNLRRGAAITKGSVKLLKKGQKVTCYGYYTKNGSTTWLLVKDSSGAIGYCSKKYLK